MAQRKEKKLIRVEIDDTVIQERFATKTYIDTFNLLYKKGLIDESILTDFSFVRANKTDFSDIHRKMAVLIEGSKNLWISAFNGTEVKITNLKKVFDKYKINGNVSSVDNSKISSDNDTNMQKLSDPLQIKKADLEVRNEWKLLSVEIGDTIIQESIAANTYVKTFNFLFKNGLINESILSDFNFVKESKESFSESHRKNESQIKLIEGSRNLWISTYSSTDLKKTELEKVFDKYGIKGKVFAIENSPQKETGIIKKLNLEKETKIRETTDLPRKHLHNVLKQAICIVGESGVGKSVRIKKTLEAVGHEKLIVILDNLWSHLLFDYIPQHQKYELTKVGSFIKLANDNPHKHYTIVIDECHKNLEVVNDSLLQAISTDRNNGKRFLSLSSFVDDLFSFLPKEDGNRLLPDNLGFVFISSKRNIIEDNDDLKNRIKIIELTREDWDGAHTIEYLLEKIKKEEPGEYIN